MCADLPDHALDARARMEAASCHDVMLARLVDLPDFKKLPDLLRLLPTGHFANLKPLFLSQWAAWHGRVAGLAVPTLAQHDPDALFDLLEREISRWQPGGGVDPTRFSGLGTLRGTGRVERRSRFLRSLAARALDLPPQDLRAGFLVVSLLAEADALDVDALERMLVAYLQAEGRAHARESAFKQIF